jgi:excinuclease ABC subunit B
MVDIDIEKLDMKQKKLLIKDLESKMLLAAENLQFEKAANLRDEIKEIKLKLK